MSQTNLSSKHIVTDRQGRATLRIERSVHPSYIRINDLLNTIQRCEHLDMKATSILQCNQPSS